MAESSILVRLYTHFSAFIGGLALVGLVDAVVALRGLIVGVMDVWRVVVVPAARFLFGSLFNALSNLGFATFSEPWAYDYATVGVVFALGIPRLAAGLHARGEVHGNFFALMFLGAVVGCFVFLVWPVHLAVFTVGYWLWNRDDGWDFGLLYLLFGPVVWAVVLLALSYALFFAGVS